jgi:hypothetical protein
MSIEVAFAFIRNAIRRHPLRRRRAVVSES